MIRNPGGAAEKTYKITVTKQGYDIPVPEEARAGEFVNTGTYTYIVVKTASGLSVPLEERNTIGLPSTTRVSGSPWCFVMPAEDVTIS
nr:MAG TPA: hypothetical protein [Caudoviricetes sp.]